MHHCEAGRADARRLFFSNRLIAALVVSILLPIAASAASDPVATFIVRADSLARSGDDGALRGFVAENVLLASAAAGQLLDAAIEAGDNGNAQGETENMALAERLGRSYESVTGSRAP
ncbi:MAG: hypothetical protein H6Q78_1683, partial [Candidatus Krumholzibacteriota bacterium]|nr:hypothetical protein [Candidatus Krumholzibacteriota bacterium]